MTESRKSDMLIEPPTSTDSYPDKKEKEQNMPDAYPTEAEWKEMVRVAIWRNHEDMRKMYQDLSKFPVSRSSTEPPTRESTCGNT